jgi:hypothetical protein
MSNKAITMSRYLAYADRPSRAWISFSYICFGASLALVGSGIIALPLDWQLRGCLAVGMVVVIWSSFMLANAMSQTSRRAMRLTVTNDKEPEYGPAERAIETN